MWTLTRDQSPWGVGTHHFQSHSVRVVGKRGVLVYSYPSSGKLLRNIVANEILHLQLCPTQKEAVTQEGLTLISADRNRIISLRPKWAYRNLIRDWLISITNGTFHHPHPLSTRHVTP